DQQVWGPSTGPYATDGGRYPGDGNIGLRYFPLWMRIQRQGNMIAEFRSDDGKLWEQANQPQELVLPATARAGIFSSSHGGTDFETAHFDNVTVGKDLIKPGPPTAQAVAGDGTVMLSWTGAPSATSYNVYRRPDPEKGAAATAYEKITATPTKNNIFMDTGLTNGTTVRYLVTGLVGTEETAASLQQPATPNPAMVIGKGQFFSQEIDTKQVGTTQMTSDGQLVITAGGSGVANRWGNDDAIRFVAAQIDGDFTLTAQIPKKPTSNQDRNADEGGHTNGGVGLM